MQKLPRLVPESDGLKREYPPLPIFGVLR